jgi:serine/threonine protein kinase/tetratricopeptide (TPR) repeat protein
MVQPAAQTSNVATFADPLKSALAGRFTIEREIGRGGMATVFLARDLRHDRTVALKVLSDDLTESVAADRFLREIEFASTLSHPHILGVLESGREGRTLFYSMPHVEAASLRHRLLQQQQLPVEEAIEITRQICDALDFAHARGVIHRDIKPENILLGAGGALLADFGIARAVTIAGGETLTKTGIVVGTPLYMSPEQGAGSHDVLPQSDIYSMACVLYEMLIGQPPFTGPNATAIFARHALDVPPRIRIVRNTVSPGIEDAILRALSKVPADRYASAGAFARALTATSSVSTGRPNVRRWLIPASAVALASAATAFALKTRTSESATATGAPKDHVAVMYLDDRSPDGELQPIANGITEALINEFSDVRGLKVVSRNGVAPYRGKSISTDSIAHQLKVGSIVTGFVAPARGDSVRINLELVDAATGRQMGRTGINLARSAIVGVPDSIARVMSIYLRRQIGEDVAQLESRIGTKNAEAWSALQSARQLMPGIDSLASANAEEPALALAARVDTMLAKVEALDRNWLEPIVERGWLSYRTSRVLFFNDPRGRKHVQGGLDHAARVLAKDSTDRGALELRGTLRYWTWLTKGETNPTAARLLFDRAEADLRASTADGRPRASAWNTLSHLLINKSQLAEAKLAAETAYNSDPYLANVGTTIQRLFFVSMDMGIRDEAERWCAINEARFPGSYRAVECRLWLYALPAREAPKPEEMWKQYALYLAASPSNDAEFHTLKGKMLVALGLLRAGLADSAKAIAAVSLGDNRVDPNGELTNLAMILHEHAGDRETALRLFAKYLAMNPQFRGNSDQKDDSWWLAEMRKDPRYQALMSAAR